MPVVAGARGGARVGRSDTGGTRGGYWHWESRVMRQHHWKHCGGALQRREGDTHFRPEGGVKELGFCGGTDKDDERRGEMEWRVTNRGVAIIEDPARCEESPMEVGSGEVDGADRRPRGGTSAYTVTAGGTTPEVPAGMGKGTSEKEAYQILGRLVFRKSGRSRETDSATMAPPDDTCLRPRVDGHIRWRQEVLLESRDTRHDPNTAAEGKGAMEGES